jgi:putative colanic acid biosynthesis acetyltransferase WcaF
MRDLGAEPDENAQDKALSTSIPFHFFAFLIMPVDLSTFSSARFDRGASRSRELLWLFVSLFLFRLCPLSLSPLKCAVLRAFGARVGTGVTIKPQVKITFPWKLTIGDHVWLGEECWLLNLERIVIGNNVCISQRAFLCTGSHDYSVSSFDLITGPVTLQDGCWIGAGSWVGQGVTVGAESILAAGSVAIRDLEPSGIYRGNPAVFVRPRIVAAVKKSA